ncbi:origin recognition complex subunit 2 [Geosmithia morbida]|uniref:Origin recognition complex subunit 2 n=1 Tax=Geosmithia morbida TaxID=1094350 RepID=A0A9P4YS14_9HYPO|nr:origin recognition complex subunit 2 [Geosmithia morbida]KAF4120581.1 origin recognition complex subunit 2 [Geosmithia morbida]
MSIISGQDAPRKRSIDEIDAADGGEAPSSDSDVVTRNGDDGAAPQEQEHQAPPSEPPKSTPRKRGRPPKNPAASGGDTPTPRARRQASSARTPTRGAASTADSPAATPTGRPSLIIGADRSARRKSARALIEQVVGDGDSDASDDDDVGEDGLAREIYDSSDEDAAAVSTDHGAAAAGTPPEATAPSAEAAESGAEAEVTRRRRRQQVRRRSPSPPPRDLPPHEQYFVQNRPGRPKTSDRTLKSVAPLSHDEYFSVLRDYPDRHAGDVAYLEALHAESFPQWAFELSQGFSICLYGMGSKRALLRRFARHLARRHHPHPGGQPSSSSSSSPIVMVNGYAPTTTVRDILSTAGAALDLRIPSTTPSSMAQALLTHLSSTSGLLTLMVNSIDAAPLRRPTHQSILARLASHPRVRLVCSADTPDFPLLWDVGLRSAFCFAFHDATTLSPYTVELDVVDDVHDLLGRNARRVNGREGVAFVLRSLPDNAKNLFQLLVGEVLIAMEEDESSPPEDVGVEYRMVYNKAVEEFICSSEMAFRTLLKDKKDALGTELLSVPFAKDELETILEDLMG